MEKKHDNNPLSEEAKFLMRYLEQYGVCKKKKAELEIRRQEIIKEFDDPILGIKYDSMPKGSGNNEGAAALTLLLDEINTTILQQKVEAAKTLIEITNILQLLPQNELERDILEDKYIDCDKWNKICKSVNLSRSAAYQYMKDGINKLLTYQQVKNTLQKFKAKLVEDGVVVLNGHDISEYLYSTNELASDKKTEHKE